LFSGGFTAGATSLPRATFLPRLCRIGLGSGLYFLLHRGASESGVGPGV